MVHFKCHASSIAPQEKGATPHSLLQLSKKADLQPVIQPLPHLLVGMKKGRVNKAVCKSLRKNEQKQQHSILALSPALLPWSSGRG